MFFVDRVFLFGIDLFGSFEDFVLVTSTLVVVLEPDIVQEVVVELCLYLESWKELSWEVDLASVVVVVFGRDDSLLDVADLVVNHVGETALWYYYFY